jgi:hypothetical protein
VHRTGRSSRRLPNDDHCLTVRTIHAGKTSASGACLRTIVALALLVLLPGSGGPIGPCTCTCTCVHGGTVPSGTRGRHDAVSRRWRRALGRAGHVNRKHGLRTRSRVRTGGLRSDSESEDFRSSIGDLLSRVECCSARHPRATARRARPPSPTAARASYRVKSQIKD